MTNAAAGTKIIVNGRGPGDRCFKGYTATVIEAVHTGFVRVRLDRPSDRAMPDGTALIHPESITTR
jgi:hypothetical protein